ncbi:MAG: shikimate dehydrogenase [Phycisphaerae bacterium]
MTKLVTSILASSPSAAATVARDVQARGGRWIEIRLDGWSATDDDFDALAAALPPGSWIATCRSVDEGGHAEADTMTRVSRLIAAGLAGAGFVDFEFADWQRSANIRQKIQLAVTRNRTPGTPPAGLILSAHDFSDRPDNPAALPAEIARQESAACVKLAWRARDITDNLLALDLLRASPVPAIVLCMGPAGLLSRVLAGKFSAFATYCAPQADAATAPGQPELDAMLRHYRFDKIGGDTKLFGVIGDPVAHSMSPVLFNACFDAHDQDAVYLPLLVAGDADTFNRFMAGLAERPWLDAAGFSVTVPHKQHAAAFLGDHVDPLAAQIGAVNTLVRRADGYFGHNTDHAGALDAITDALGCDRSDLADLPVEVLGAGGAARAIVAGLRHCGAHVTLFNRNATRARELAQAFSCRSKPWEDRGGDHDVRLVINCTPLGMWPNVDETPLPAERLEGQPVVFDTVYNPMETRLLREARLAGCVTVDGVSMFIHQAAAQYRLWFDEGLDKAFLRSVLTRQLSRQDRA